MFKSPWIRKPDFPASGLNYDGYWEKRGWKINSQLKPREEVMFRLLTPGLKVLDLGCGNSLLPVTLKNKGVEIEVADISHLVLNEYEKLGIKGRVVDLKNLQTCADIGSYDFIIMSEVLEHLSNPEEVIIELKKHTKNFIFTVPNSASYQFRYGLMFRGRFFTQWLTHPSEHLRFWSHIDFLDWLRALGLKTEKAIPSEGFSLRGRLTWLPKLWKNFLAYRVVYVCKV